MLMFLRCVGEAVAAKGLKGLIGLVPMGEQIYEIASEAIERYRRECREARLREDVEQMVQASIEEVRNDAHAVANEVLSDRPPEEIAVLEQYLTQVPAVARQSLVHPQDLSGKSVPAMMNLLDPLQFGTLLPKRTPRFRNGETVPGSPQWRFVQLLGAGGFGEVWQAQHTFLDKQRAYKFCLDPAARDRLLRHEGEIIKRVMIASAGVRPDQHGIVPLEDAYLEGDAPWLAYEYVAGGDLAILVREHATKTPEVRGLRSLQILTHLADVIGRFHTLPEPIIHRDLKPANILLKKVGKNWLLRVTDFGISHVEADRGIRQATISTPQINLGETYRGAHTPIYASPQQKRGMKPDVRDDVHALGIIGWQLLLGDLSAERPAGKWRKRLLECQLSEPVLDLLESCWDDDPEERPANAAVLAMQLRSTSSKKTAPVQSVAAPMANPLIDKVKQQFADVQEYALKHSSSRRWYEENQFSIEDWKACAKLGLHEAMSMLARCYDEGIGVEKDAAEALNWFQLAADLGNPASMNNIGYYHDVGRGVTQSHSEAMKWYLKAADAGYAIAMRNIGILYENGQGVKLDFAEAMKWYLKAADAGYVAAMTSIGILYHNGCSVKQDYVSAMKWYLKAADADDATAMYNIGLLYENGQGVKQDYAAAMKWYLKAADAGYEAAMTNIGTRYHNGQGVKQDYAEAMKWYLKAADADDATGMNNIGLLYEYGQGVKQDYAEALKWYLKAADAGYASAMRNIGILYNNGYGVKQDYAEAMKWYLKAADAGDATAMNNIGTRYHNGQGVKQDYAEAMKWYLKAADADDALSMTNIGILYHNGYGVKQDYAEAMNWYLKAADAGDETAMNNIGVLCRYALGVQRDYAIAMQWFQKAAELGSGIAMRNIGSMYEDGEGVAKNLNEAKNWYQKAINAGDVDAKERFAKLTGRPSNPDDSDFDLELELE
ncbi:MAG: protein kinase [Zavarzinella sp.]